MFVEKDVRVPTRDGSFVMVDVYRPDGDTAAPVITSFGPYGKDVHWPDRYPLYDLVPQNEHMVWETPNPVWWVERGYAVVRADSRGTGKSPGDLELFGPKDAEDYYDLIEWAGTQPWSAGRVASSGISWLAMMGWRVAALNPPHLAALIAWEGSTDFYREMTYQGGLYCDGFINSWWVRQIEPQRTTADGEDWRVILPEHPLVDEYHRVRQVDLDHVTVPVLSAGNWGALQLHLRGNIEGWKRATSPDKWLVVHTGTHIDPYYADWALDLQLRFLDRYLKEQPDRMKGMAPVRLAIRHGRDIQWRDSTDFPLPETTWKTLYLDVGELSWNPPAAPSTVPYASTFDLPAVTEPLEITGPISLRLWTVTKQDDFDVLARLHHIDASGDIVPGVGPQGGPVPMAMGWLRASHREIDPDRSAPHRPWHPHETVVPVPAGEPTLLEVEIWPTSISLERGEHLRLELVTADDDLDRMRHSDPNDRRFAADVLILTGGDHQSSMLVPVIPRQDKSSAAT